MDILIFTWLFHTEAQRHGENLCVLCVSVRECFSTPDLLIDPLKFGNATQM